MNILDDELVRSITPSKFPKIIFHVLYFILAIIQTSINAWWIVSVKHVNSMHHNKVDAWSDFLFYMTVLFTAFTIIGLIKSIRLNSVILFFGIILIIAGFYLLLGPILVYYDS